MICKCLGACHYSHSAYPCSVAFRTSAGKDLSLLTSSGNLMHGPQGPVW